MAAKNGSKKKKKDEKKRSFIERLTAPIVSRGGTNVNTAKLLKQVDPVPTPTPTPTPSPSPSSTRRRGRGQYDDK